MATLLGGALPACSQQTAQSVTQPAAALPAATTDSPAIRELQKVEDKWANALNQRDQYGLELVLSPLFMDVSSAGVFSTRNQQIANLITLDDKTAATEQRVVAVRMLGDVAVATGTYSYRHRVNNADAIEKGVFTHVFERQHGNWVCVSAQRTPIRTEVPGEKTKAKTKTKSQAALPFHIPLFSKSDKSQ
uniref:DUF4440 domain-containing protein n=1 Tax=mine drainage metagenome TaxID=410659 RepID=E6QKW3_9ZZZZ